MFSTSEISFHTGDYGLLYNEPDPNKHIGLLQLRTVKHDPTLNTSNKNIYVLFSVDCSASMTEITNNQTKMSQAIHTLKRIFAEFAKEPKHIYVSVIGFETDLHPIIEFTQITPDNVNELTNMLDNITAKNATNIEIALKHSQKTLAPYQDIDENNHVYHIIMTDGHITSGESDVHKLKNMVDTRYPTVFVGFGSVHDSELLHELSNYLRGEYYFIDNIENSGYVYGEIVYNIIYHAVDAVQLTVRNGLIYNWKTNQWVADLEMANLAYDSEKLLHIITYGNIHDIEIDVSTFTNTTMTETLYCYPPLLEIEDYSEPDSVAIFVSEKNQIQPVNLAKYHYRQKTQELMFESRVVMDNYWKQTKSPTITIQDHKLKLRDFLKNMLEFMKTQNFMEDLFMRRLGDDIYVLHNTIGQNDAGLWINSRQVSQGRQQTYSASQFDEDNKPCSNIFTQMTSSVTKGDVKPTNIPVLKRQHTIKNLHNVHYSNTEKLFNKSFDEEPSIYYDQTMSLVVENQSFSDPSNSVDFWNEHRINNDFANLSTVSQNLANTIRSITTDTIN
jgi:Mg-chelatase subunit ChlD